MDNPLTTADVDAADQQDHQNDIGAANIVMETTPKEMANPDDVADAIKTSKAYSNIYGTPEAPTSAAIQFKSDFSSGLTRAKNSTVLSTAPILSAWARDPDNAALARDDLSNLGWWEAGPRAAGQDLAKMGLQTAAGYQQFMAEQAQQRMRTQGMSFSELLAARQNQAQPGWKRDVANVLGGPSDIMASASQWVENQIAAASGVNNAAAAQSHLQSAGALSNDANDLQGSVSGAEFNQGISDYDNANPNATWFDKFGNYFRNIAANPGGFTASSLDTIVQSLPPLVAATVATAATKNPAIGALLMGATSYGQERYTSPDEFFKAQGIDIATPEGAEQVLATPTLMKRAQDHGLIRGTIIGVLNGLSGGIAGNELMKNPIANLAVQTVIQSALGAVGEAGAEYATTGNVDMTRVIQTAISQAVTAPIEVFGVGGRAFMQSRAKAKAAEARVNFFKAMSDTAQASKLRERLPEKYRQYVDAATKGGPIESVYVPADKFVEYFQSKGQDPGQVASVLDGVGPEDLNNAIATGGDLKIPTASYATHIAGTEHDAFFSDNMKFQPDAMTASEARDFNDAMEAHLDEVTAQAQRMHEDEEAARPHEQEIYDTMVSRLRAAGRSTDVATSEATLFPAFYRTMAGPDRTNQTVEELMRKYPLPQIRGSVPEALQAARGGELTQTIENARAQAKQGGKPSYPLLNFIHDYGGIIDTGGELHARDAAKVALGKGKKTLKIAREVAAGDAAGKTRHSIDTVAHAAMEAGFLDDHPAVQQYRHAAVTGEQQPDITPALYDAIDKEMAGTPQHAGDAAIKVREETERLDNIQRYLEEIGTSLDAPNEDIEAAIEAHRGREYGQSVDKSVVDLDDVRKLIEDNGTVFVRWSRGPEFDMKAGAKSRDYQSGGEHEGVSAVPLNGDLSRSDIVKRLREYNNASGNPHANLYAGEVVGRDSDGYDSIRPTKYLGSLSDDVVSAISDDSIIRRMELEDMIASGRDVLKGYETSPPKYKPFHTTESVEKLSRELDELGGPVDFVKGNADRGREYGQASAVAEADGTAHAIGGGDLPAAGLVPANLNSDGKVYIGRPRETHFTVVDRYHDIGGEWEGSGFVTPDGEYLNREEALAWVDKNEKVMKPSENMGRSLDALDYREQVPASAKATRRGREYGQDQLELFGKSGDPHETWGDDELLKALSEPSANTSSEAFKNWFGNSKVTDDDGKPQVVYHNSHQDFEAFDRTASAKRFGTSFNNLGIWFSNRSDKDGGAGMYGPKQYPVYLKMEKPFVVHGHETRDMAFAGGSDAAFRKFWKLYDKLTDENSSPATSKSGRPVAAEQRLARRDPEPMRQWLKDNGYDGLIMRNTFGDTPAREARGQDMFVVLEPEQVKSTENRGTFDPNDKRFLFQGNDGNRRGSISIPGEGIGNGDTVIRLFDGADLSTMLHESGHFFLSVMQDMALKGETNSAAEFENIKGWWRENASAVAKDAGKGIKAEDVIKALDEGTTGDAAKDAAIDTGMQEQFARAFEAYLMEGKAPSAELQGAFDKFRTWLVAVYKKITGLGVKVSPQITRVFDRMLASDEQIQNAQAESAGGLEGFTTAEQLGMTPKQWDAFQAKKAAAESDAKRRLLASIMGPVRREASKEYKAEKKAVNEEVSQNYNSYPVYRATEWLSKGRWLGDKKPEDVPALKLNRKQLVDAYGPGILSALPRGVSHKDGADVDIVAGHFGFGSGDEMVKAMRDAPKREDAIEAETERRMAERHNDPLTDGSIENESLRVVNGERRGEWIAEELKAIHEVAGLGKPLKLSETKGIAKAAMGRMVTRDAMNDRVFLAAMRKAADEAARLSRVLGGDEAWLSMSRQRIKDEAAKGNAKGVNAAVDAANAILDSKDGTRTTAPHVATSKGKDGATRARLVPGKTEATHTAGLNETIAKLADAKRRQLLNHALYQESRNIQAEVAKAERFVARLGKASTREKIAGAARRGGSTVDYLAAIDEVLRQYDFSRLSGRQEQRQTALADYVQAMKDAGRENEIGSFTQIVAANAARGQPYKTLPVDELRGVYATLKNLEHTASIWDKHLDDINKKTFDESVEAVVGNIDNNLPKRPPGRTRSFKENARNGARGFINLSLFAGTILREIDRFEDFGDAFSILKRPIDKGANGKQVAMEEATRRLQKIVEGAYTKAERYGMSRKEFIPEINDSLSKNERLAVAANMGNAGNLERLHNGERYPWTPEQVQAIIAPLDARDARYIQGIWDFIGSFKDEIAATERARTGTEPKWVEPEAVNIGGVDLRGGYYPISYDPRLGGRTIDQTNEDIAADIFGGRAAKAQTKDGHTLARATTTKRDLLLDMQTILSRHINQVITDIHLGDAVVGASRILNDARVQNAFRNAGRDTDLRNLKIWLLDTASGQMHSADLLNRSTRKLKNNLTFAKLGFNLMSAAKQISGTAQTAVVLGKKYTAIGIRDAFRPGMTSQIPLKSSFMAERKHTFNQHISDFMSDNTSGEAASRLKDYRKNMGKAAFAAIQTSQYYTADVPSWLGGYQRGLDQFGNDEAKAIEFADDIVRRSQGSGLMQDRSGFERGSVSETARQQDFIRMFTALASYTFTKANAFYERTAIANRVIRENGASLRTAQEALSYAIDAAFLFSLEAVVGGAIAGHFGVGSGGVTATDSQGKDENWLKWIAQNTAWSVASIVPGVSDISTVVQGNQAGGAYGSVTHDLADPIEKAMKGDYDKKAFWKSVINGTGLIAGAPSVAMNRIIDSEDRRQGHSPGWSPLEYIMGQRGSRK